MSPVRIPALLALSSALALSSFAQGLGLGLVNAPTESEARPPIHVRPNASTSPVGYKPSQVRFAYGLDKLAQDGTGQVIGIVDAYGSPSAQNDLNVFSDQFGIPRTTIQTVYGTRKPGKSDAGWALETSLDLQWAHAFAPKAKLILAVAASASLSDLLAAVDAAVKAGATIISMSWGAGEFSTEPNYESHFKKTGVTFLASSGDNGSGTLWPSVSPNVVSVGGTTLNLNTDGTVASETGWSGSGGGFSTYFARPAYQDNFHLNTKRAMPDVSLVADPNTGVSVYDSTPYNGQAGWFQVGGTSASCPMWGAIIALSNQARGSTITGSNSGLYSLATASYSTHYFDIISGSNGGYNASTGYDEVTGLGTPNAVSVVSNLK